MQSMPDVRRVLATAAAAFAFLAAPAGAADVTIEGELLTPVGPGAVEPDANASSGRALRIAAGSAAEGVMTTTRTSVHVFARVRGNDCFGLPTVSIKVDGVERFVGLAGAGYGELGARLSVPAGPHAVSVGIVEGSGSSLTCQRSAWIDTMTLVAEPFSPGGWRNKRLKKNAPLAGNSAAMVAEIRSQVRSRPRGALIGTTQYSSPIYTVGPDQPAVRVAAPEGAPALQRQWDAVPLPADARPAAGTDGNLILWQPATDTLWEFWGLSKDPLFGTWRARYGGRMPHVSQNEGHFVDPPGPQYGASATSIALMSGLQRIEELRRGAVEHAIGLVVIGRGGRDGWCWPAQRTDPERSSRAPQSIPAGARFRFPARFDLAAYASDPRHPLSRYALTIARAIQRYGLVVTDASTEIGFAAEDPTPLGYDPYVEIFEGRSPDSQGVLANFPWRKLQALAQPRGRGCVDDPDRDR
ncbi:MAG TPA: hypothetical protein VF712_04845 [Thermoleophilaceae bacterium]